jgi:hypothetical protein
MNTQQNSMSNGKIYEGYKIVDLQNILYNIKMVDIITIKINEILDACDVAKNSCKPCTNMTAKCIGQFDTMEKMCNTLEKNIADDLGNDGIYEENAEDVEEKVTKLLKRKLCNTLRHTMDLSVETRSNMEFYVDQYFQTYDISNRTEHLARHIKEWILFMQEFDKNRK